MELLMASRKIELPWVKRAVMRDLAFNTDTQTALAAKYGVTQSAMSQFQTRHADEIEEIRANSEDEFAGILIANKANRLATYERLLEAALVEDPVTGEMVVGDHAAAARILKQVAEEMGHLPTRMQINGDLDVKTRYEVVGVQPEDLT